MQSYIKCDKCNSIIFSAKQGSEWLICANCSNLVKLLTYEEVKKQDANDYLR